MTKKITKSQKKLLLSAFGEGAEEAPLFQLRANYCDIPKGTLVEVCAHTGRLLGQRLIADVVRGDGSKIDPMAFYEGLGDDNWGWFVPPQDLLPLTPVAEELLADVVAARREAGML